MSLYFFINNYIRRPKPCNFAMQIIVRSILHKNDRTKAINVGTMDHVATEVETIMGVDNKSYDPHDTGFQSRKKLTQFMAKNQKELPIRTIDDSFVYATIPLSSDPQIRIKYTAIMGTIRIGRLLEDMDMFAVYVCLRHILNPKMPKNEPTPYIVVTVLVDKINLTSVITKHDKDIRIFGHITWVGTSSLEVVVWLEQLDGKQSHLLLSAVFMMAVRESTTMKAAIINAVKATTPEEQKLIDGGKIRKEERIRTLAKQLTKVIPNEKEQEILHELFMRTLNVNEGVFLKQVLPSNCDWMEKYTLSNLIVVHPEHRNLHNNVFGGFIMRAALEVSFGLGYLFTNSRPLFKTISDINFNKPISLNSLIHMHAYLVCTKGKFYQISVHTNTWDTKAAQNFTSNTFHFTYESVSNVKEIFPKTYRESMTYIDGYRQLVAAINSHDRTL
ncbi:hypothetical protein PPYR_09128 [Photinus pyralis]|uniref:HotDog ACOT-type domain-containing protein n=1 Tax=Photinus pyralis TaxID=7054 RepID=A0A5N4ALA0_PHOPY|nr:acyl-coenzyme A thioesterase 9, mitochondrial-like [Photinus pyralis]KAB0798135.1 hypothetical protein PPYR_09128 [Photinus pyralis]